MSENRDFDFCPRCGALMQDGVCRSCGYSGRFGSGQASYSGNGMGYGTRNTPKKKKTRGWVIASKYSRRGTAACGTDSL